LIVERRVAVTRREMSCRLNRAGASSGGRLGQLWRAAADVGRLSPKGSAQLGRGRTEFEELRRHGELSATALFQGAGLAMYSV